MAASSAAGPCGRAERMVAWYSGSHWSIASRVSSVRWDGIARSAWQNRTKARSTAGALARYGASAMILRGIQSPRRISMATGLHRIGSPGP